MKDIFCSDCAFFKSIEVIDPKYPMIKRGRCLYHDKPTDNRWSINCKDFKNDFDTEEYYDEFC